MSLEYYLLLNNSPSLNLQGFCSESSKTESSRNQLLNWLKKTIVDIFVYQTKKFVYSSTFIVQCLIYGWFIDSS